jgi:hypothetical protein
MKPALRQLGEIQMCYLPRATTEFLQLRIGQRLHAGRCDAISRMLAHTLHTKTAHGQLLGSRSAGIAILDWRHDIVRKPGCRRGCRRLGGQSRVVADGEGKHLVGQISMGIGIAGLFQRRSDRIRGTLQLGLTERGWVTGGGHRLLVACLHDALDIGGPGAQRQPAHQDLLRRRGGRRSCRVARICGRNGRALRPGFAAGQRQRHRCSQTSDPHEFPLSLKLSGARHRHPDAPLSDRMVEGRQLRFRMPRAHDEFPRHLLL